MKWEDYGISSLTLLAVHVGMDKKEHDAPHDPSDLKRCLHLFQCLKLDGLQIIKLLERTAGKHPEWIPFANNWNELMRLWSHEKDRKSAPKLYAFIQKIRT